MLSFVDCKCCRLSCQHAAFQTIVSEHAMEQWNQLPKNFILPRMTILFGPCHLSLLKAKVLSSFLFSPLVPWTLLLESGEIPSVVPKARIVWIYGWALLDCWEPACNRCTAMKSWHYSALTIIDFILTWVKIFRLIQWNICCMSFLPQKSRPY